MLLLIPASVVTVAAALRAALALRRDAVAGEGTDSSVRQVEARLRELHHRHGTLTAADVRAEADAETLRLFALLQPLSAMAALAPLAGLLGSVTALMAANADAARRGGNELLAAAVERALVPSFWGVGVAAVATAAYLMLRARLYVCETQIIRPAAEAAADRLLGRAGMAPGRGPGWPRTRSAEECEVRKVREEIPRERPGSARAREEREKEEDAR